MGSTVWRIWRHSDVMWLALILVAMDRRDQDLFIGTNLIQNHTILIIDNLGGSQDRLEKTVRLEQPNYDIWLPYQTLKSFFNSTSRFLWPARGYYVIQYSISLWLLQVGVTVRKCYIAATQLNSTQLNSTQLNPTQLDTVRHFIGFPILGIEYTALWDLEWMSVLWHTINRYGRIPIFRCRRKPECPEKTYQGRYGIGKQNSHTTTC